ncbi:hypothetical protein Tco_1168123, partial [Tanacetum coccineum]
AALGDSQVAFVQDSFSKGHGYMEDIKWQTDSRVLQIGIRAKVIENQVMATPTILVSAEGNLEDPIEIRMDIIHPETVAVVAFPAATVMRTLAQHEEAIRGIQEQLVGVPIHEELMALRFRIDIAKGKIAIIACRK